MKLIVGNLKMNLLSPEEREKYLTDFKKEIKDVKCSNEKIVLCVPSIHLEYFARKIKNKDVAIGGQNLFHEDKGSFTGETSGLMLKNAGAEYVLIGHSERRKYFAESSPDCNEKNKAALRNRLVPIYCVGETLDEKLAGSAEDVIIKQITEAFANISATQAKAIVIAYEPVWSVGSDKIPTSDEILQVKILIKKTFAKMYSSDVAEKIHLLYGGSVKAESVGQVCIQPGLDGVLVGRESLVPRDFLKIIKTLQ